MMKRSMIEEARGQKPRAFTLELTKGCNLRCGYCYYAGRDDAYDPRMRMSPEVARRSVDLLLEDEPPSADASTPSEVVELPAAHLHFFGGEPLLNFDLLADTVHYGEARAAELGRRMTFEVTTNGTRLSENIVAFLNEHRVKVGVSFDGPPEIQDVARPAASGSSHDMALPGIRRLLESRAGTQLEQSTHCSVVLTRRDFDVLKIVRYLEELGFRRIILTPATDLDGESNGYREEDLPRVLASFDALADAYEEEVRLESVTSTGWYAGLMDRLLSGERRTQFCGGGRDYLGVAADGKVNLCYRFYENEEFGMGSVQEGIDHGVTQRLDEHALETRTACSVCWARYFCGGGCHHDNVTDGGGLGDPNPILCDLFRHSMGRTIETWARLSRDGVLPGRGAPAKEAGLHMAGEAKSTETAATDWGLESKPRATAGCHVRELDGERVIYEPRTHEVCVLNGVAGFILELCDGERSVGDILARLEARYAAPREVLQRDLERTLDELEQKRLLH